jgi:thiamine phosphate synthase YjbQ (UPF0047 family)
MALVSAMHITSGVYVNDWGERPDRRLPDVARKAAPAGMPYKHHRTARTNADAHLKRTLDGSTR